MRGRPKLIDHTNPNVRLRQEVFDALKPDDWGTIELAPRFGKTKLMIDFLHKYYGKDSRILWVTTEKGLVQKGLPEEFKKWHRAKLLDKVTISTYTGIREDKPEVLGEFDVVILDEVQCVSERLAKFFYNGLIVPKHAFIGMTGTPIRNKTKRDILRNLGIIEPLISIDLKDAAELGILSDYNINVIYTSLDQEANIFVKTVNGRNFYTSEQKKYDYISNKINYAYDANKKMTRIMRMNLIKNTKEKERVANILLSSLKGRTLFFAGSIPQVEKMLPYTFHSKSDKTYYDKFQNEEIDILGLVNAGGTGHTYKNIKHVVVIQANSDDLGNTSQKIARALLNDDSNKMAEVWLLCTKDTVDEQWVERTLLRFNPAKVNRITDLSTLKDYIKQKNDSRRD